MLSVLMMLYSIHRSLWMCKLPTSLPAASSYRARMCVTNYTSVCSYNANEKHARVMSDIMPHLNYLCALFVDSCLSG